MFHVHMPASVEIGTGFTKHILEPSNTPTLLSTFKGIRIVLAQPPSHDTHRPPASKQPGRRREGHAQQLHDRYVRPRLYACTFALLAALVVMVVGVGVNGGCFVPGVAWCRLHLVVLLSIMSLPVGGGTARHVGLVFEWINSSMLPSTLRSIAFIAGNACLLPQPAVVSLSLRGELMCRPSLAPCLPSPTSIFSSPSTHPHYYHLISTPPSPPSPTLLKTQAASSGRK